MDQLVCEYHEEEEKEDEYFLHLNNGSLVVMDGCMQADWQHRVPKEYHDKSPRINLSFCTKYKFENGSPYSNSRVNNCTPVDRDITKNLSKIGIDLDIEDCPHLGPVSSNVNPLTVYNFSEKAESSQPRTTKNTNKISEKESEMNNPSYESLLNINGEINYSEEQWTLETSPYKTTSRINDVINGLEKEWRIKTQTFSKALLKENEVNSSQVNLATQSITDATAYPNKLYEEPVTKPNGTANKSKENFTTEYPSNNKIYSQGDNRVRKSENRANKKTFSDRTPPDFNISNISEEEWTLSSPVKNDRPVKNVRTPPDFNISNISEEEWILSSPVKNDLHSQCLEITTSNYNYYKESAFNNPLTLPESDSKSHKDWYEESCNDQNQNNELREEKHNRSFNSQQTSLKSDKMNQFDKSHFEKTYLWQPSNESNKISKSHKNRNVKYSSTRPNRFHSDNIYKHHEEGAAKPFSQKNMLVETNRCRFNKKRVIQPHYNKNISRQERNFKFDERKNLEYRNSERSATSNDEMKSIKAEFSNEITDDREQRSGKNQNFNSKKKRKECSSFAVHIMGKDFSDTRNEHGSNRSNGWKPNVKAEEFIPGKIKLPAKMNAFSSSTDNTIFDHFSLEDLPNYDIDRMPSDVLKSYATALKSRVLNRISEFEPSDKEELEVLCEITDGSLTDKNQKIICSRICTLVNRTLPNEERNRMPNPTMPRYRQRAQYSNRR